MATHLNLAVRDTIKKIALLNDTLDMAYEITKLVKNSPKREAEFHRSRTLGHMERGFYVYNMDSPTLKILGPTRWTVQAASLSAIMKIYRTLMNLWGWVQDNVSDSDMKARIIGVQTKIQILISSMDFSLPLVLSHSNNLISSFQRAELCAVGVQKNAKFSVTVL